MARLWGRLPAVPFRPGDLPVLVLAGLVALFGLALLRRPAPRPAAPTIPTVRLPLAGVTVLLDPGHGGTDSGVIRRGSREDALNYRLAATVGTALRQAGATVVFTVRSEALDVPIIEGAPEPPLVIPSDARLLFNDGRVWGAPVILWQRAAAARPHWLALAEGSRRSGRGLYFLSLHHDEAYPRSVRGARVAFDRRDGSVPAFARVLARRLSEARLDSPSAHRPIPLTDPRRLGVLNPRYNPIPQKALLEAGTISNARDRERARTPAFRWQIARLVVAAVAECEGDMYVASDSRR